MTNPSRFLMHARCLAGLLLLGSPLVHSGAAACSGLPPYSLEVVSSAQANGPFYFLLSCSGFGCSKETDVQLEVMQAQVAVEGTFLRVPDQPDGSLFQWTPQKALLADVAYEVRMRVPNSAFPEAQTILRVSAASSDTDLSRIVPQVRWEAIPVGTFYHCDTRERTGQCTEGPLVWSTESELLPVIDVTVSAASGWLFDAHEGSSARDVNRRWEQSVSLQARPALDTEACFVVDGWNLTDGSKHTRTVCATPEHRDAAARHREGLTPDLSECSQPPVRQNETEPAQELLREWCAARRTMCTTQDIDCGPEPLCATTIEGDPSDGSGDAENDGSSGGGCQLSSQRPISQALSWAVLVLACCWLRRKRELL